MIGMILLIGIVKKNGIMMVDFAITAERRDGMSPQEAIRQACLLRFRPDPDDDDGGDADRPAADAGHGPGSELRQPLGFAMVGGLALSQLLTLYTTPLSTCTWTACSGSFPRRGGGCRIWRRRWARPPRTDGGDAPVVRCRTVHHDLLWTSLGSLYRPAL